MNKLVKYDITNTAISNMKQAYMDLTIDGIDDKEGFEAVHEARMVVKGKRVEVDKKRVELKADALAWGKKVDSEAKRITALLLPIENYLKHEEDVVTVEKQRIKEEKEKAEQEQIQARIDELAEYDVSMPFFEVAALSDDEYQTILPEAKLNHANAQAQKDEEERIRKEKDLWDRAARESEAKQLAKERAEIEKLKHKQDKKNAEIQAAHKKREAELKVEQERLLAVKQKIEDMGVLEAAKKAAAEFALKEEKEKREREEKEKIDRENSEVAEKKRKELLKPDKEKLIHWIEGFSFSNYPVPSLESTEAQHIIKHALQEIEIVLQETLKLAENL